MTKTLWLLAVNTEISLELHAIYAVDRADATRQAQEKEHSGKQIDFRECPGGFTLYRLVLPGKIVASEASIQYS